MLEEPLGFKLMFVLVKLHVGHKYKLRSIPQDGAIFAMPSENKMF